MAGIVREMLSNIGKEKREAKDTQAKLNFEKSKLEQAQQFEIAKEERANGIKEKARQRQMNSAADLLDFTLENDPDVDLEGRKKIRAFIAGAEDAKDLEFRKETIKTELAERKNRIAEILERAQQKSQKGEQLNAEEEDALIKLRVQDPNSPRANRLIENKNLNEILPDKDTLDKMKALEGIKLNRDKFGAQREDERQRIDESDRDYILRVKEMETRKDEFEKTLSFNVEKFQETQQLKRELASESDALEREKLREQIQVNDERTRKAFQDQYLKMNKEAFKGAEGNFLNTMTFGIAGKKSVQESQEAQMKALEYASNAYADAMMKEVGGIDSFDEAYDIDPIERANIEDNLPREDKTKKPVTSFNTIEEAEAAGLKPGTKITVGGKSATWQ